MTPMRSATAKGSEESEAQRSYRSEAAPLRRRRFAAHAPNGPGPEVPGNTPVETPQETPEESPFGSPEEHPDSVPPQSPPNPPPEMPELPRSTGRRRKQDISETRMLSVRKNAVAVQKFAAHERADSGVARFGFIHHRLAWQCRLDATGDSWLRLAHERKARSLIPAGRIGEILAAPDNAAAIADIVIADFLRRACRHLPHELVAHVRGFTIAWVRDAQRLLRRQGRRARVAEH